MCTFLLFLQLENIVQMKTSIMGDLNVIYVNVHKNTWEQTVKDVSFANTDNMVSCYVRKTILMLILQDSKPYTISINVFLKWNIYTSLPSKKVYKKNEQNAVTYFLTSI